MLENLKHGFQNFPHNSRRFGIKDTTFVIPY